jgi:hypothetical protein
MGYAFHIISSVYASMVGKFDQEETTVTSH